MTRTGTHLTLDEDVEEVLVRLLVTRHQVAQDRLVVVGGQTQPWQVTDTGPLVVQAAALRAGQEIQELVRVGGHHGDRWRCEQETAQTSGMLVTDTLLPARWLWWTGGDPENPSVHWVLPMLLRFPLAQSSVYKVRLFLSHHVSDGSRGTVFLFYLDRNHRANTYT